eukprot:INCI16308.11.p2 GENE.INCI16308.11~~INCI16308.11.p2  ORF type:complete len:762 (+),score=154.32 INCI16308.11:285-2570(+)
MAHAHTHAAGQQALQQAQALLLSRDLHGAFAEFERAQGVFHALAAETAAKGVADELLSISRQFLQNPFLALQLQPVNDRAKVKKAYFRLARKYHPDKSPGTKQLFVQIQEAYELLRDDRSLERAFARLRRAASQGAARSAPSATSSAPHAQHAPSAAAKPRSQQQYEQYMREERRRAQERQQEKQRQQRQKQQQKARWSQSQGQAEPQHAPPPTHRPPNYRSMPPEYPWTAEARRRAQSKAERAGNGPSPSPGWAGRPQTAKPFVSGRSAGSFPHSKARPRTAPPPPMPKPHEPTPAEKAQFEKQKADRREERARRLKVERETAAANMARRRAYASSGTGSGRAGPPDLPKPSATQSAQYPKWKAEHNRQAATRQAEQHAKNHAKSAKFRATTAEKAAEERALAKQRIEERRAAAKAKLAASEDNAADVDAAIEEKRRIWREKCAQYRRRQRAAPAVSSSSPHGRDTNGTQGDINNVAPPPIPTDGPNVAAAHGHQKQQSDGSPPIPEGDNVVISSDTSDDEEDARRTKSKHRRDSFRYDPYGDDEEASHATQRTVGSKKPMPVDPGIWAEAKAAWEAQQKRVGSSTSSALPEVFFEETGPSIPSPSTTGAGTAEGDDLCAASPPPPPSGCSSSDKPEFDGAPDLPPPLHANSTAQYVEAEPNRFESGQPSENVPAQSTADWGVDDHGWVPCTDAEGNVYYFNNLTQTSSWEVPLEARILVAESADYSDWIRCLDENGDPYHFNIETYESSWETDYQNSDQ